MPGPENGIHSKTQDGFRALKQDSKKKKQSKENSYTRQACSTHASVAKAQTFPYHGEVLIHM